MKTLSDYAIEQFTPDVIGPMLATTAGWEAVEVEAVTATAVGTGQMASSYRLQLHYSRQPIGAPDTMIAKVPSTDPASRQMAVATGAYQREVLFYRHLRDLTAVSAARCYFAEIASDLCGFVLLLEDLGPASTVDQISGCTPDQADLALAELAALHGGSWKQPRIAEQAWLPAQHVWSGLSAAIPQVTDTWLQRFGPHLRTEHVDVITRLGPQVGRWVSTLAEHRTLWHGDFRLDNLLFDAQNGRKPIAVVDWQSTAAAPGVIDVSYFLGNSLTEDIRGDCERDLVVEYHRRLSSYGVQAYNAECCWREYQAHALYGLILTIPVSLGVQSTPRGDEMFAAMAARAAQQIIANDSYAALAALAP